MKIYLYIYFVWSTNLTLEIESVCMRLIRSSFLSYRRIETGTMTFNIKYEILVINIGQFIYNVISNPFLQGLINYYTNI